MVRGSKFDTNLLKAYTKSGIHVEYIVWPALLLHKNGPVLVKGVAQGYGRKLGNKGQKLQPKDGDYSLLLREDKTKRNKKKEEKDGHRKFSQKESQGYVDQSHVKKAKGYDNVRNSGVVVPIGFDLVNTDYSYNKRL